MKVKMVLSKNMACNVMFVLHIWLEYGTIKVDGIGRWNPPFKKEDRNPVKNCKRINSNLKDFWKKVTKTSSVQLTNISLHIYVAIRLHYKTGINFSEREKSRKIILKIRCTDAILMNLSKTFDTINHELLQFQWIDT